MAYNGVSEENEPDRILLVDDDATNLRILQDTLSGEGYRLLIARNGESALSIARKAMPSLILLDIMMPGMDGFEVCRRLKEDPETRDITVVFVTALTDAGDEAKGLGLGATDYIFKPFTPELVLARVKNHLELKRHQDHLEKLVGEKTREVELLQAVTIESLATLAEYRDPETGGHIKRTQNYVKVLARQLMDHPRFADELDPETVELLYRSAPLHDVGKVGVPDVILLKQGRLTEEEFVEMKKHAVYGRDALLVTEQKLGKSSFMQLARQIAYTHQEKWDGSGYPQGLKGDEIPLPGRLMALADVYDALISKRVYKPPFSHEKAVNIIEEGRGRHFDPDIVDAFLAIEATFRKIALAFADYEEERQMLRSSKETPSNGHKIVHVLLVEDQRVNLEIMESQLSALGYVVDTATNGRKALEKYRKKTYDLILTDLTMPEMDGYALCAEIRRAEAAGNSPTPVLAVTAEDFELTAERAKAYGFDGYMLKPLDPEILQKKFENL